MLCRGQRPLGFNYQSLLILPLVKINNLAHLALDSETYCLRTEYDETDSHPKIPVIQSLHVSVSHTTEDLVFEWLPEEETPLVVDDGIELPQVIIMVIVMVIILLPQLELIQNFTADCTTNYSTGSFTCLEVVFRFKRRLGWVMQTFMDFSFHS